GPGPDRAAGPTAPQRGQCGPRPRSPTPFPGAGGGRSGWPTRTPGWSSGTPPTPARAPRWRHPNRTGQARPDLGALRPGWGRSWPDQRAAQLAEWRITYAGAA